MVIYKQFMVFMKTWSTCNLIKKLSPIVTELFLRGKKLNILLVFTSQSYFKASKTIKLHATHYVIMKTPTKSKIQK